MTMAATPKQAATANARLNKVVHMSRSSMIAGGSATGLSATGACIVRVVMADDGCEVAPYPRDCRGDLALYSRSHLILGAVAPLAGTAYSPDIRAWPCLSRLPGAPLPKGNADFGWAVARRSCGCDQVRADTEAMMATGTVKWFNPTKGYGFIQPQDGGRDVFVHISAVEKAGLSSLNEGQTVEYEVVSNRGKESADNLKTR
jgi:CspA family cold shock protein